MWSLLILALAVLDVECMYTTRERLENGRRLSIKIPKEADRLEFVPAEPPSTLYTIWSRGTSPKKGRIYGSSSSSSSTSDQRWELSAVGFDDEGTYRLMDYWNKEIKAILLAVTTRHSYIDRVAGEDLYISLEGSNYHEATLVFSGESGNYTLVKDGAPVGNDLPDYSGRVKIINSRITITWVNSTDVGRYRLYDSRDRLVSVTKMTLVDEHPSSGNPLLALLLLLGIPAGVCCCCRKKIFRKKATTTATHVIADNPPPGGPPSYNTPMIPPGGSGGQVFYHGGPTPDPNAGYSPGYQPAMGPAAPPPQNPLYPSVPAAPGYQPGYDPQNPAYPPPAPAPAGPPQWNGPPPGNQYAPAAPDGQPSAPTDVLSAAQFQLDAGKGSNFL
ncbi:wu:fc21g02 isoform X2 [Engraulis encrasicolus]|uniref:wu:fc21g02 isoform X2 n=1 Tax=Engraulis encrasicolus TaxID=184585 RepID=UPI002FCE8D65